MITDDELKELIALPVEPLTSSAGVPPGVLEIARELLAARKGLRDAQKYLKNSLDYADKDAEIRAALKAIYVALETPVDGVDS